MCRCTCGDISSKRSFTKARPPRMRGGVWTESTPMMLTARSVSGVSSPCSVQPVGQAPDGVRSQGGGNRQVSGSPVTVVLGKAPAGGLHAGPVPVGPDETAAEPPGRRGNAGPPQGNGVTLHLPGAGEAFHGQRHSGAVLPPLGQPPAGSVGGGSVVTSSPPSSRKRLFPYTSSGLRRRLTRWGTPSWTGGASYR